jgi:hypothetical protein
MPTSVTPRSLTGEPDDGLSSVRARPAARRHRRTFGHVRRLPSKRYQASYLGPDGGRHVAPTTFQSKGDADAWLSLQSAAIIEGRWHLPGPQSNPCRGSTSTHRPGYNTVTSSHEPEPSTSG